MKPSHRTTLFLRVLILLALSTSFVPFTPLTALPAPLPAAAAGQNQVPGIDPVKKFSLFKDIYTANRSSDPDAFFGIGSRFRFNADNGETSSLWASDGTSAGTVRLADINGYPKVIYNGKTYFAGNTTTGSQGVTSLWVTDGTPQGTRIVKSFSSSGFSMHDMVVFGGWLYFSAELSIPEIPNAYDITLWRTDGTEQNTAQVSDLTLSISGYNNNLVVANNALYFAANDEERGTELFRLASPDGQPEMVKDICVTFCQDFSNSSDPDSLTAAGNKLFFMARDETHGAGLWVSDGTESGTYMVMDLVDEGISGKIKHLTAVGDWLYFFADDGVNGERLWRTDGSPDHTSSFPGYTFPPSHPSRPTPLAVMNGALFFPADDGMHGIELWKISNPQAAAGSQPTPELIDILPGPEGSIPDDLTAAGQGSSAVLYFAAQDKLGNRELWRSGGTAATTWLVKELVPGPDGGWPSDLTAAANNIVFFTAVDPVHNREPWVSDGTAVGTQMITDLNTRAYTDTSFLGDFKTLDGITYFTAEDALHGVELWRTDNTPQGTFPLRDFAPGPMWGTTAYDIAELNNIIFFAAPDSTFERGGASSVVNDGYGSELWRSDGTREGTWRVKDIRTGPGSSYPNNFTRAGDRVYFFANDGIHGRTLWKTDGTADGTERVADPIPGTFWTDMDRGSDASLTAIGNMIVFTVTYYDENSNLINEIWRSDGTSAGTVLFYKSAPSFYTSGTPFGWAGKVYLGMRIPGGETRLYVTDATTAGTHEILTPGAPDAHDVVAQGGFASTLYFTTISPSIYNSPDEVTTGLWKLAPGATTAEHILDLPQMSVDQLTPFGDSGLFFRVTTEAGSKWWISDGTAEGTHEICPACAYQAVEKHAVLEGQLYFVTDGESPEIWITDGTEQGTRSLSASQPDTHLGQIQQLFSNGDNLYLADYFETRGTEMWAYSKIYNLFLPAVRK